MRRFLSYIPFVFVILLAVGCQDKDRLVPNGDGGIVVFGSAMNDHGTPTKTEYFSPGEGFINWSGGESLEIKALPKNGTEIEASGTYSVTQGQQTRSPISHTAGNILKWISAEYTFYGFYPASIGAGFDYANGAETLNGLSVAPTQAQDNIMESLYMFARKEAKSQDGNVWINFYPLITTVGISISNLKKEPLTLTGLSLTSSDKDISGTFSINFGGNFPLGDNAVGWPTTITNGGKVVAPSGDIQLAPSSSQTIYLMLAPQIYAANSITLSLTCGDLSYSKSLGSIINGIENLLPAHKYYIGLTIKDEEIIVTDLSCKILVGLLNHDLGRVQAVMDIVLNQLRTDGLDPQGLYNGEGSYAYEKTDDGRIKAKYQKKGGGDDWQILSDETIEAICEQVVNMTGLQGNLFDPGTVLTEEDFAPFVNMTSLEMELQNVSSIDLSNMLKLESVSLNHGGAFTIKNCPNLSSVSLNNIDPNTYIPVYFENCPSLTSFETDQNGQNADYMFKDMNGLNNVSIYNAHSIQFDGAAELSSLTVTQATNLKTLTLKDTPLFTTGSFQTVSQEVSVKLANCSTNVSSARIEMHGNGNAINAGKVNSDHVVVYFYDNENREKAVF